MKKTIIYIASFPLMLLLLGATINDENKSWKASDNANTFVEETIAIGFLASPHGAGWKEKGEQFVNEQRQKSLHR